MIENIQLWGTNLAAEGVCFKAVAVADRTGELGEDELSVVANVVSSRQNTFSSGRHCAKNVLHSLGVSASEFNRGLAQHEDGSAVWPDGVIGSISHTNDWALAAATLKTQRYESIGVDIEKIERVKSGVLRIIATEQEQAEIADAVDVRWARVGLFSVKESLYKCLRPIHGKYIRFNDVQLSGFENENVARTDIDTASETELPPVYSPSIQLLDPELQGKFTESRFDIRVAVMDAYVVSFVGYRNL